MVMDILEHWVPKIKPMAMLKIYKHIEEFRTLIGKVYENGKTAYGNRLILVTEFNYELTITLM